MRRRTSPVQQWVDSLPSPSKSATSSIGSVVRQQSVSVDSETQSIPECTVEQVFTEKENFMRRSNMTVSTPISVPQSPAVTFPGIARLARDPSFQSDSSRCSSVESLLELRRADPEAILLSLGFGGDINSSQDSGPLSRIPKRFLQPSRLKGIAIDEFVKHQQETTESLDSTSLGYRGLTGSPYVAPSEIVQKIMQRLREHETHDMQDAAYASFQNSIEYNVHPLQQQEGRLSVLSPDNRQYLERPRSKSPDMRNKRMIIGQRSFAFGNDGDLIEINPVARSTQSSQESDDVFAYSDDSKETNNYHTGPTIHTSSRVGSTSDSSIQTTKPRLTNDDSSETMINVNNNNSPPSKSTNIDKNHYNNNNSNNEPKQSCSNLSTSPRRASDGSCEQSLTTSVLDQEEGRRSSDSVMYASKKSETDDVAACSASRKKSLRRQARVKDPDSSTDNIDLVDDDCSNEVGERRSRLTGTICTHCNKPVGEFDSESEISCCYKRTSQNCWREMEEVLQKNKKLEEVVNKSRREMAEIKDMLSSVLSVRMEPGF